MFDMLKIKLIATLRSFPARLSDTGHAGTTTETTVISPRPKTCAGR